VLLVLVLIPVQTNYITSLITRSRALSDSLCVHTTYAHANDRMVCIGHRDSAAEIAVNGEVVIHHCQVIEDRGIEHWPQAATQIGPMLRYSYKGQLINISVINEGRRWLPEAVVPQERQTRGRY
jgi:hypothetical protein